MWTCPKCERRFGRAGQGHDCAPALSIEEYFDSGPPFERPIFESVRAHLTLFDPDVYIEPVSVGIFFKRRSRFLALRTMTRWVAVCFSLERRLETPRLSRKVIKHGSRFHHVINIKDEADIDDQLLGWIAEAWQSDG